MTDRDDERLAPITPLFGRGRGDAAAPEGPSDQPSPRHPAWQGVAADPDDSERRAPRLRALHDQIRAVESVVESTDDGAADTTGDPASPRDDEVRAAAEEALVRKLRARSLSVAEARTVLKAHDLAGDVIGTIIDEFCHRGYLDDALLAGHLVTSGVERKGQGRIALGRALAQRGIPRDIVDAALAELPDDDAERALEFARTKARAMTRLDFDTALRRLVGQLARRGYAGSVAMDAARTALREAGGGTGRTSGVRFVDSD